MRSWLFVPGDSEKKLQKAVKSRADVLIIDLEDSVSLENKSLAREITAKFLEDAQGTKSPRLFVRVNDLTTELIDLDLDAVLVGKPDGICLPKCTSGADLTELDAKITAREPLNSILQETVKVIVVATETAASVFNLSTYPGASRRLEALTWGAEDLSADLAATTSRDENNILTGPYKLARDLSLLGAVAANVQPVDTVYTNFRDDAGLRKECEEAARDGFTGKMAIHPAQIPIINEQFTPSDEKISMAQRIISAFENSDNKGVVGLDGMMLDQPHFKRAQKLLERAKLLDLV